MCVLVLVIPYTSVRCSFHLTDYYLFISTLAFPSGNTLVASTLAPAETVSVLIKHFFHNDLAKKKKKKKDTMVKFIRNKIKKIPIVFTIQ